MSTFRIKPGVDDILLSHEKCLQSKPSVNPKRHKLHRTLDREKQLTKLSISSQINSLKTLDCIADILSTRKSHSKQWISGILAETTSSEHKEQAPTLS